MRCPAKKPKAVILTHIINPHQFYFKYLDESVNSKWSKFDYEIQVYGNQLHKEKSYEKGYAPVENELVIFFNVIFNKWIRGRTMGIAEEVTLMWCVDIGVMEKCTSQLILPLDKNFHEDMKLVHLGGLYILPVEQKLNCDTLDIEMKLSDKWDNEMLTTFKTIVNNSKSIEFTEEFELSSHKFGSLTITSKKDKIIVINKTFVDMNKAAHTSENSKEDLSTGDRLEHQLNQSDGDARRTPSVQLCSNVNSPTTSKSSIMSSTSNLAALKSYDGFDDSAILSLSLDASQISENDNTNHSKENDVEIHSAKTDLFDLENSSKGEVSLSVLNSDRECYDEFQDSASVALSSTVTLTDGIKASPSKTYQQVSRASSVLENDYDCNLRTCAIIHSGKLRPPLEMSINCINSMCKSTEKRSAPKISCATLYEIGPTSQKYPSNITTTKTKPICQASSQRV